MRKRFEQQIKIGQRPIAETRINPKSRYALMELLAALKELYCNDSYNERLFKILEKQFTPTNKSLGRPGMDLWSIFVLAQVRLCENIGYEALHDHANNHKTLRQLIGAEFEFGYESTEYNYNTIYDNVSKLSDATLRELNLLIVDFGHNEIFKKKEQEALHLKSDSFVVESNVHFPTDYNLLWDCLRKMMDVASYMVNKYSEVSGWRKLKLWYRQLKNLTRAMGQASAAGGKNKADREKKAAEELLEKAQALVDKFDSHDAEFPMKTNTDLTQLINLDYFKTYAIKHINLLKRRVLEGEKIPHEEKVFSVFETYTEWVKKGKSRPNLELGKKVCITTDQYNLILDHRIMDHQQDSQIVLDLAQDIITLHKVNTWSFDKGYWNKDNKELLGLYVGDVIMPKKGKLNQKEKQEESTKKFKLFRNKHSAVESNINELEQRGADRCPDRGWEHFQRYIGLSVCAYNLKKIGRNILQSKRKAIKQAA